MRPMVAHVERACQQCDDGLRGGGGGVLLGDPVVLLDPPGADVALEGSEDVEEHPVERDAFAHQVGDQAEGRPRVACQQRRLDAEVGGAAGAGGDFVGVGQGLRPGGERDPE